jgi:hypothetical protein
VCGWELREVRERGAAAEAGVEVEDDERMETDEVDEEEEEDDGGGYADGWGW